jgi:hypothetical protein
MEIKNELKGLIYTAGFTFSEVAKALKTSTPNLSQKISRGTLKYCDLKKILEIIGYEVTFKKISDI